MLKIIMIEFFLQFKRNGKIIVLKCWLCHDDQFDILEA